MSKLNKRMQELDNSIVTSQMDLAFNKYVESGHDKADYFCNWYLHYCNENNLYSDLDTCNFDFNPYGC